VRDITVKTIETMTVLEKLQSESKNPNLPIYAASAPMPVARTER